MNDGEQFESGLFRAALGSTPFLGPKGVSGVGVGHYEEEGRKPPFFQRPIDLELGNLSELSRQQLTELRRDFAFKNHPDRVPAHAMQEAEQRMMIANQRIDAALEKL